jgi:predicted nuclease of predicted toxin-antitoxin system
MRFVVDAQLPPALARWLVTQGQAAEHVTEVGLLAAEDRPIWDYALRNSAVIISKDEDFPTRAMQNKAAPCIVWVRLGNCSNQALLQWFAPLLPKLLKLLDEGHRIIELR